jgi:SAM-dependent methyltransferase
MPSKTEHCRHCGQELEVSLLDLGRSPLANAYVEPERADCPCPTYELHARVCANCFLVQVGDVVPPDEIFTADYAYFSSFSDSWLDHSRAYVDMAAQRFDLGGDDLVIEIGSNDGYLLQYFVDLGVPVLGIEPAQKVAQVAMNRGVATRVEFFSARLARQLKDEGMAPSLICSANVLAHVPDINDFVRGVATLLTGNAVYSVEFPHILNLIEQIQFDTIYHEHFTYLSLVSVERIFDRCGLRVFDVQRLATHGGSLRVFACLKDADHAQGSALSQVRALEHEASLDSLDGYRGFQARVDSVRSALLAFLEQARSDGKSVAAYGAAAKGNTLLNYCGIGRDLVSFCVDRNPAKQRKLLPGSHIPVFDPGHLRRHRPDFILILPWNLRDEIMMQLSDLCDGGSSFVIPLPHLEIIGP